MTTSTPSSLARWTRRLAWASLLALLLLPLAAFAADRLWGREVLLIAPHDPAVVTLNRALWTSGEPVAEIYGSPMSAPTRVLLRHSESVLHPEEDASLSLLAISEHGARPVQSQTLWWATRLGASGLAGLAVLSLLTSLLLGRRGRGPIPVARA